jgi:hypothetical protein
MGSAVDEGERVEGIRTATGSLESIHDISSPVPD